MIFLLITLVFYSLRILYMRLLQCLSKAFLNPLIVSALKTSSGRLFQLFMTRSEKMFCLCTLFADGFL